MRIHLIRHGEVANPDDFVYADIPGFALSDRGRSQATAAGHHLADTPPRWIVSSPLDRAIETSRSIATIVGAEILIDDRLTEWGLAARWRGATWAALPAAFPGELEAYLEDPTRLPFSPESLAEMADRVTAAIAEWSTANDGDLAFVSHQDPIHAAHLRLTGKAAPRYHESKPNHGTVITLQPQGQMWRTATSWDPPQR